MLYNEVRPKTIEEVVGNSSAVETIKELFADGPKNAPRVFLLHGPTGTGKTTLARIIGNQYLKIDAADLLEVNAAEARGIDVARALIGQSRHSPLDGDYRLIVLDEAHQLTSQAQQSLLKAVEDTEAHSFWIFCTTEPQGLTPTLRNRCVAIQTRPLRGAAMMELLVSASVYLSDDGVAGDTLKAVQDAAEGCPRQALVMLEKVAFVNDLERVKEILADELGGDGLSASTLDLCRHLVSNDRRKWGAAAGLVGELSDEPEKVRVSLSNYLRGALLRENSLDRCDLFSEMIRRLSQPMYSGSAKADLASAVFDCTQYED